MPIGGPCYEIELGFLHGRSRLEGSDVSSRPPASSSHPVRANLSVMPADGGTEVRLTESGLGSKAEFPDWPAVG